MAALGGAEAGRDGVQACLAAGRGPGTTPIDAVRSTNRSPKPWKHTEREWGHGRDMGLD